MTAQKHIRLDDDVNKLVEDWRRQQTPIPSVNQSINTILRSRLKLFPNVIIADTEEVKTK